MLPWPRMRTESLEIGTMSWTLSLVKIASIAESLVVTSSCSLVTSTSSPLVDSISNDDITCTECPPSETQKICVSAQTLYRATWKDSRQLHFHGIIQAICMDIFRIMLYGNSWAHFCCWKTKDMQHSIWIQYQKLVLGKRMDRYGFLWFQQFPAALWVMTIILNCQEERAIASWTLCYPQSCELTWKE